MPWGSLRGLLKQGNSVGTLKVVQTGCGGFPEDIDTHREIMGLDRTADDKLGLTCPYVFELAKASPHLAARSEGVDFISGRIVDAIRSTGGQITLTTSWLKV